MSVSHFIYDQYQEIKDDQQNSKARAESLAETFQRRLATLELRKLETY